MNTLNKKNKNANKFFEIDELILPYSKLRFCSEQLQNLNYSFQKHLRNKIDTEKGNFYILLSKTTYLVVIIINK